jgi:ankyrin repeat protein
MTHLRERSTYASRGSVFKLNGNDHVTHSPLRLFDCDLEIPPTAKLSHLSSLKDVQRELLDQVQRHEDYKNLLAIYELTCFDLFSREGYGSSDTKSAVLRLESLYTEMGYEDRAASICKDFSEGYIREQIHRPDLEVVSKPLILDAYHCYYWPKNLGRADIHHPLHLAAVLDDEDAVRIVLRGGADIDLRTNTTHWAQASYADGIGYTALYLAIRREHNHMVQLLLEKGANVNAGPPEYFTALHAAAEWGNEEVVQALLQRGADIDAKYKGGDDDCGYTALHVAAEQGHEHIVRILLQEGADPNATCEHSGGQRFPALYFAALKGHEKVVYLLLNGGADAMAGFCWGQTALSVAFNESHHSVVHLLRSFSLHSAARDGNVAAVREALAEGVDVNQTWEQQSALFAAVSSDQEEMVGFLLDNQANANTSVQSQSVLHVASDRGNMPIVEELLYNGAETDVVNSQGCTPLAIAAMSRHEDIGQLLIQYGAKVAKAMESLPRGSSAVDRLIHWADLVGATESSVIGQANDISLASEMPPDDLPNAIFKAVEAGGEWKVENLIRLGAPVNNRYTAGKTLVHLATSKGYLQVLRVLLENGANVNGSDDCLQTALHYVAQHPEWSHAIPVAGLLIRKGAHDSITDYRKLTPYDIAKASNNTALLGAMSSCKEPYPDFQPASNLAEVNGSAKTVQSLKEYSEGELASESLPTNGSPKTLKERDLIAKDALLHTRVEPQKLSSGRVSTEMQRYLF